MKKDKELWKDIQGYEGLYQISSLGRVKRLERENKFGNKTRVLKEMIMTPVKNRHGYMGLNISIDKKMKPYSIHRLVATHFIQNIDNLPEVNHIDGNKNNNVAYNLEWCTRKENMSHARSTGLINHKGDNSPIAKLTNEEVKRIRKIYKSESRTYEDLAEEYGVGGSTIGRIIRKEVYTNA